MISITTYRPVSLDKPDSEVLQEIDRSLIWVAGGRTRHGGEGTYQTFSGHDQTPLVVNENVYVDTYILERVQLTAFMGNLKRWSEELKRLGENEVLIHMHDVEVMAL